MTKAFHILVSLFVAIPLGAGGLCCCFFSDPGAGAAGEPIPSCCAQESAPVEPKGCPAEDGEESCGCPDREDALLAKSFSLGTFTTLTNAALIDSGVPEVDEAPAAPTVARVNHPPPKIPLHRAYCVLLC